MIKSALQSSLTNDVKYRNLDTFNVPSSEYLIETALVGTGGVASVTFSNLGQYAGVYQHLFIRAVARTSQAATSGIVFLDFNGSAGTIGHYLLGDGSSVSSDDSESRAGFVTGANATSNAFGGLLLEIPDAFETTKNKTAKGFSGPGIGVYMTSALLASTSAITSLTLRANGSFVQYSRFSLYGVTV